MPSSSRAKIVSRYSSTGGWKRSNTKPILRQQRCLRFSHPHRRLLLAGPSALRGRASPPRQEASAFQLHPVEGVVPAGGTVDQAAATRNDPADKLTLPSDAAIIVVGPIFRVQAVLPLDRLVELQCASSRTYNGLAGP